MKRHLITILTFGLGLLTLPAEPKSPSYQLHEWGTFTSVFGSDGQMLPGLDREEEQLPPFVHAHAGMGLPFLTKGWRRPLTNVTVKMETPVIYFYTDTPFSAHVDVQFHGGSISQWYPQRSGGETPPPLPQAGNAVPALLAAAATAPSLGAIDFSKGYEGSISWDIEVLEHSSQNESKVFMGAESPTWLYPRFTDSNVLKNAQGQHEKYLFYRGVGNFAQPIRPSFNSEREIRLENTGDEAIPYALLFDSNDEGILVKELAPIPGKEATTISLDGKRWPAIHCSTDSSWRHQVYGPLVSALVDQGLYQREADSMVRTWWASYFGQQGCRIFWIVPPKFVEKVLPLKVTPAPADTKRILVGRSELLKPSFEKELLSKGEEFADTYYADRFYGAYEARVRQLTNLSMKTTVQR